MVKNQTKFLKKTILIESEIKDLRKDLKEAYKAFAYYESSTKKIKNDNSRSRNIYTVG